MTAEFEQYAMQLKEQKLFETEVLFQEHLDEYSLIFQKNFHMICGNIQAEQKKGDLGSISYLEYTLLYTNLIRKQDTAEIRVYDHDWYFDSRQCTVGYFDFSFLFIKYRELWTELMTSRKRFAGAVTAQEVLSFVLPCARQFFKYVSAALRFSILPCTDAESFRSIRRTDEFEINIGEYMSGTEPVYKENRLRTSEDALSWFKKRLEFAYAFEDFSGLDFSGADLSEIDLRYSDLRQAKLKNTDFQDAMLFGTRFCQADLEGADLRYCLLHEADFTQADLTGAKFNAARAYRGIHRLSEWMIAGYRSVSFREANLTNADFRKAEIQDADFTGAIMNGTRIHKTQLRQFNLSPEQKKAIRLE